MRKADFYFRENLLELKQFGHKDENPRPKWDDGTPAHSIFTTQVVEKYDISRGEIPITEARSIAWKSSIKEMLAIYQTQTNTRDGFESHGVFWWENWFNEKGDIGRAYSYNLESHRPNEMNREVVKVKRRLFDENKYEIKDLGLINPIEKSLDGKTYSSEYRGYGDYIILDYFNKEESGQSRKYAKVQFLNNGYITNVRADSLTRGQHPKNNFTRTLFSVGYMGDYHSVKNFSKEEVKKFMEIWRGMMARCYDNTREHYEDVYVSSRWHSFENFLKDVRQLPQYHLAKEKNFKGWHLDKDYFGSNCYSFESCVFLNTHENSVYRSSQCKPLLVKEKEEECIILTHTELSLAFNVSKSTIARWVKNGKNNNGNIIIKEIELEDDYVYRYELSRNQVNELLRDLEYSMYSRRNMTSFFNWGNHNKKELVECAYETIWTAYKKDDGIYLDMTLIQRSSDVLTANHINKIQYVAFMLMVAKHCGYKVGNFVHFIQNYHIYDKHLSNLDIVLERLDRKEIKNRYDGNIKYYIDVPDKTNFYDISWKDFKLEGYHPVIEKEEDVKLSKFELAI